VTAILQPLLLKTLTKPFRFKTLLFDCRILGKPFIIWLLHVQVVESSQFLSTQLIWPKDRYLFLNRSTDFEFLDRGFAAHNSSFVTKKPSGTQSNVFCVPFHVLVLWKLLPRAFIIFAKDACIKSRFKLLCNQSSSHYHVRRNLHRFYTDFLFSAG